MKRTLWVSLLTVVMAGTLFSVAGFTWHKKHPAAPTIHIDAASPCAEIDATGTIAGRQYALSIDRDVIAEGDLAREGIPKGLTKEEALDVYADAVACPGFLDYNTVGLNLPATLDARRGTITIAVPNPYYLPRPANVHGPDMPKTVEEVYDIESARAVKP